MKPVILKLLTIGQDGAGKTSVVAKYCHNEFDSEYFPTIGVDFRLKTVEKNGIIYKIQVWDVAGHERFGPGITKYYPGAQGIIVTYDVTNLDTFTNLSKWLKTIKDHAS